eukprot:1158244-Pelagomonas_calceolata.AAC.7
MATELHAWLAIPSCHQNQVVATTSHGTGLKGLCDALIGMLCMARVEAPALVLTSYVCASILVVLKACVTCSDHTLLSAMLSPQGLPRERLP